MHRHTYDMAHMWNWSHRLGSIVLTGSLFVVLYKTLVLSPVCVYLANLLIVWFAMQKLLNFCNSVYQLLGLFACYWNPFTNSLLAPLFLQCLLAGDLGFRRCLVYRTAQAESRKGHLGRTGVLTYWLVNTEWHTNLYNDHVWRLMLLFLLYSMESYNVLQTACQNKRCCHISFSSYHAH